MSLLPVLTTASNSDAYTFEVIKVREYINEEPYIFYPFKSQHCNGDDNDKQYLIHKKLELDATNGNLHLVFIMKS